MAISVEFLIQKTATVQIVVKFQMFVEHEVSSLCSGNLTAMPTISPLLTIISLVSEVHIYFKFSGMEDGTGEAILYQLLF